MSLDFEATPPLAVDPLATVIHDYVKEHPLLDPADMADVIYKWLASLREAITYECTECGAQPGEPCSVNGVASKGYCRSRMWTMQQHFYHVLGYKVRTFANKGVS
jgi:hypothetical protein